MEFNLSDSADKEHAMQGFANWCVKNNYAVHIGAKGSCTIMSRFNWICHVTTNKAGSHKIVLCALFFGKQIAWDKIKIYHGSMAILVKDFNRQQRLLKFSYDGSLVVEALRLPRKLTPTIFRDYLKEIEFALNHQIFNHRHILELVLEL